MEYLKKIAVAAVCGKITKPTEKVNLMRVYGIASAFGTMETNFGQSTFLTGQMRAVNLATGEQFESAKAFLPDIAIAPIASALAGGADSVEFGFDIHVKPSDKGSTGYEYGITPLVAPATNEPLSALEKALPALPEVKAIAAPKAAK
jgi:hypothetical protein